ncbi:hypothetical protein NDU88_005648 [Pleurodeles waltl]|uniref:Uncharacterized protein n=1 Tax=Pleurodeles waltl TaxID=8319 RepID=A0AAV7SM79_PLEWA|nr:hypothetical protein NDU88_005648 [Pleurodeles waltl]
MKAFVRGLTQQFICCQNRAKAAYVQSVQSSVAQIEYLHAKEIVLGGLERQRLYLSQIEQRAKLVLSSKKGWQQDIVSFNLFSIGGSGKARADSLGALSVENYSCHRKQLFQDIDQEPPWGPITCCA